MNEKQPFQGAATGVAELSNFGGNVHQWNEHTALLEEERVACGSMTDVAEGRK